MATSDTDDVVVRPLTSDDLPAAARVFVTSLGDAPPPESAAERFARYWDVDDSLGAFDGAGRLLGVAATAASEITVEGGAAVSCAAVPSVGVRPDSHRRGVGRALLERQVREADDRGAATLALNASEVAIYGRYGYGPTSRWWSTEAATRTLAWRDDAPVAAPGSIAEIDDPDEAVTLLRDVHRRAFGRWPGEVARWDGMWWLTRHPREGKPGPFTAVHRDVDGTVDAAIRFTIDLRFDDSGFANVAEVVNSVGLAPVAEALLWRWLAERHLLGTVKGERTNPRLPVHWMLIDPRRFRTTADGDAVWVRIVDVARVLGARTTRATASVRVRVVDPLVPRNDRTWSFEAAGSRLEVTPTEAAPEVTLPVDLLASAAWGHVRVATLVAAGRVTSVGPDPVARLDALLATDGPAWCSTGF